MHQAVGSYQERKTEVMLLEGRPASGLRVHACVHVCLCVHCFRDGGMLSGI